MKIILDSTTATTISKVTAVALSDDRIRQHLRAITVASVEAGTVSFTATDGYIAHRVTVTVGVEESLPYPIVIDGASFSNALIQAGKVAGKNGKVELSTTYDGVVTVATESLNIQCDVWDIDPAPVDTILSDTADTTGNVLFNGSKLTDIVKAATLVVGKNGILNMVTMNDSKPAKITADTKTLSFVGVIMPCRSDAMSRR